MLVLILPALFVINKVARMFASRPPAALPRAAFLVRGAGPPGEPQGRGRRAAGDRVGARGAGRPSRGDGRGEG